MLYNLTFTQIQMLCFHRQALGGKAGQDDKMCPLMHGKQFQRDHAAVAAIPVAGLAFKVSVHNAMHLGSFVLTFSNSPISESSINTYSVLLVLAGVEVIFFIVASMGLYFGFVLKTGVITQGYFCSCWTELTQSPGLFCFLYCPTSE